MPMLPSSSCSVGRPYVASVAEPSISTKSRGNHISGEKSLALFIATQTVTNSSSTDATYDELQIDGVAVTIDKDSKHHNIKMALIKGTTMRPTYSSENFKFISQNHNVHQKPKAMHGPMSQYELSKKARAMGIHVDHIHDGSTIPSERRLLPKELNEADSVTPDGGGVGTVDVNQKKHGTHDGIVKLPMIKHPYESDMPPVMHQREPAKCELPVCTTSITPHLKPLSSSPRHKKTENLAVNSSVTVHNPQQDNASQLESLRTFRFIVSPKSFHDFKQKPETYYSQRFPHVVLDSPKKGDSSRTKNQSLTSLPQITRSKTDLTVIEREINRTAQMIKPLHSISGWLEGFHCKSKAIHTRPKMGLTSVDRTCKTFRWSW